MATDAGLAVLGKLDFPFTSFTAIFRSRTASAGGARIYADFE
jgi:hypothetical protein